MFAFLVGGVPDKNPAAFLPSYVLVIPTILIISP